MDTKKLRELAEAATPGPWELWTSNSVRRITAEGQQDGGVLSAILCGPDRQPDLHGRNRERDLEYIVAANPTTILALLDENDSLRAEVVELCGIAERLANLDESQPSSGMIGMACMHRVREILDAIGKDGGNG